MATPVLSVPLRFVAPETPVRRGEPVTVGLPWPRGAVRDDRQFRLVGPDGAPQLLQTKVLDRWPDGSIRWCLFDFLATVDGANDDYRLEVGGDADRPVPGPGAGCTVEGGGTDVQADAGRLSLRIQDAAVCGLVDDLAIPVEFRLGAAPTDRVGMPWPVRVDAEPGIVRTRLRMSRCPVRDHGLHHVAPLEMDIEFDLFAGSPVVRVRWTVRNPLAAEHPGGNWDLGNHGSITINRMWVDVLAAESPRPGEYRLSAERGQPFQTAAGPVSLHQESSGGENWQSTNHLTRSREVPFKYRGYQMTVGDRPPATGLRATPIVTAEGPGQFLGVAVPEFWENFPKTVSAGDGKLSLDLFPGETELQGGEQKTHTFYIAFGKDTVTDEPMVWCRSPLLVHADPDWYASTGAIPYLTPKATDPNAGYLALAAQAIEGPDTFLHKREKIDEYGWRHFGDIYGDHEAVYHPGPAPLISHYNNQYDCVAGFGYQFLRSGDPRWWAQMVACADHTCDIDVYHTDGDKPAYNRGLFWHTYHYADADTGTHRAYPRSLRRGPTEALTARKDQLGETGAKLQKAYAVGGGPAASHNYNHGLMLAYFLTGNPLYRDTAVGLARFVIDMDDPARTPFRFLSREYTGLATESGGGGYHGPGRAAGNSVNALLVGHQLTGDPAFLAKAEQIIRRVSHPAQDLDSLDLLNAELRWFYTLYLQAVGRYLDYKADLGQPDRMYAYARLTLLHYARWMAAHERPILDTPDRLQYPTETWTAQDIRKVEVFQYAAKHAAGEERAKFLERADWFFRYVERTLAGFPTKSLCRPVVLMMNFGWSRAWWQRHPDATAPQPGVPASAAEFGTWRMFVPQKAIAIRRAKRLFVAGVGVGVLAIAAGVWWLLKSN